MIPDYPITRKEKYLANIAGQDIELPIPQSREEHYLNEIAKNGGGGGGGVDDYRKLKYKPSINGVPLDGNKTSADLDLTSLVAVYNNENLKLS